MRHYSGVFWLKYVVYLKIVHRYVLLLSTISPYSIVLPIGHIVYTVICVVHGWALVFDILKSDSLGELQRGAVILQCLFINPKTLNSE